MCSFIGSTVQLIGPLKFGQFISSDESIEHLLDGLNSLLSEYLDSIIATIHIILVVVLIDSLVEQGDHAAWVFSELV